jgi:catechol-2,3-dioxygenase
MKLLEIEILSNNLIKTEKFYSEVFDFDLELKSDEILIYKVGTSKLIFKKSKIENPIYHFAFEIPQNVFEESIKWISNKVNLIKLEDNSVVAKFEDWNAKSIYFFDNNKNILEFITRFDNDESDEPKFDKNQIIKISEIAFVAENVSSLAKLLLKKYNLGYFAKQIQTDFFSVLGGNDGLFILVAENRNWYPTNISAKKYPIKVKIGVENQIFEFVNK